MKKQVSEVYRISYDELKEKFGVSGKIRFVHDYPEEREIAIRIFDKDEIKV